MASIVTFKEFLPVSIVFTIEMLHHIHTKLHLPRAPTLKYPHLSSAGDPTFSFKYPIGEHYHVILLELHIYLIV